MYNASFTQLCSMKENNTTERDLMFWGATGPCMVLATLLLATVKHSPISFYFPLASLFALPLCWQWKLKGFVSSCFLLAIFCVFLLWQVNIHEQYWVFGIVLSLVLGFLVTALSREEINDLVGSQHRESENRLDQIRRLNQTLVEIEREKNQQSNEANQLKEDLKNYRDMLLSYQKTKVSHSKFQHVAKSMWCSLPMIDSVIRFKATASHNLEEFEKQLHQIQSLNHIVTELGTEKNRLLSEANQLKEDLKTHIEDLKNHQDRLLFYQKTRTSLAKFHHLMKSTNYSPDAVIDSMMRWKATQIQPIPVIVQPVPKSVPPTLSVPTSVEDTKEEKPMGNVNFEARYYQLRQQFQQKADELNQTRQDLFYEKEKLEILSREKQEQIFHSDPLVTQMQKYIIDMDRLWKKQTQKHEAEIENFEELVTKLLSR